MVELVKMIVMKLSIYLIDNHWIMAKYNKSKKTYTTFYIRKRFQKTYMSDIRKAFYIN